uniref:hypothetical protein n=1 Tax=Micromonospora acroterricola TaxID=2202421 RepID=UPI0011B60BF7|nr:hypothetical protein [Micromonospora acroterricola]
MFHGGGPFLTAGSPSAAVDRLPPPGAPNRPDVGSGGTMTDGARVRPGPIEGRYAATRQGGGMVIDEWATFYLNRDLTLAP